MPLKFAPQSKPSKSQPLKNFDYPIVATNNCLWLTNLDHGKRHSELKLMNMKDNLKYNKTLLKKLEKNYGCKEYPHYDNYDL